MNPIIKIEVEHMKQAMLHAFSEQLLNTDTAFKAAIEDACKSEKVQAILTEAANKYLKEAIESETEGYFRYGDGRKAIAEKIKEHLDRGY